MKKISILLLYAILTSSCSMEQIFLIPTTTPTPSATSTIAPTEIPTLTATIATPTFTLTPTLAGQKTETPTPDFTPTSSATVTTIPNTPTATVEIRGFVRIFTSGSEFFKEGVCEPTSVKFTAQVADVGNTAFVLLFVRFKSKQTGATGEWADSIAMQSIGAGTFVHDLVATEMKGLEYFKNAWVEYQFVSTNSNSRKMGGTGIFGKRLTLLDCVPTPTPLISSTISATP